MMAIQPRSKPMNSIHITQNPLRMSGTPCFVGTRVPVKSLFDYLEAGDSLETFFRAIPHCQPQHCRGGA
jgi:uncharacterized protein (DUF433 family)